jgi:hypothetical protein
MNSASAKMQHRAIFWESLMWRYTTIERGRDIANVSLDRGVA